MGLDEDARQARIEKATKVEYDDAIAAGDRAWIDEESDSGVEDACEQAGPGAIVWLCEREKPQIDAYMVLERFTESLELRSDCDAGDVCTELNGLHLALEAWNAKQTPTLIQSGTYKRYVIAPDFEKDGEG